MRTDRVEPIQGRPGEAVNELVTPQARGLRYEKRSERGLAAKAPSALAAIAAALGRHLPTF